MRQNLHKYLKIFLNKENYTKATVIVFLIISMIVNGISQEEAGNEIMESINSRMSISVVQYGNRDVIKLEALVRARIDNRITGIPDLEVQFYSFDNTEWKEHEMAVSNDEGKAFIEISTFELYVDSTNSFLVKAVFNGNDNFNPSEDEASFQTAKLYLETEIEDSLKYVNVKLESNDEPIADEDISLFVKALIIPYEVSYETTDEQGVVTFEFPNDLPGDPEGNIIIFAKLDDHSDFGTLEAYQSENWGSQVIETPNRIQRTLWSKNPPLWLLFTFFAILLFIWGHYIEVIYRLVRVSKK